MEFCSAEMSFFFIGLLCMSRKKRLYHESKKIFISRKLYKLHSKPLFYAQKLLLHVPFFAIRKNSHFHKPKGFLFQKALRTVLKSRLFHVQKAVYSHKLSLFPPKITLFCPPSPISTSLNLLFAKNTAVLLLFALNPYAVKPEPRTDSNHCRRYPATPQLFAKLVT